MSNHATDGASFLATAHDVALFKINLLAAIFAQLFAGQSFVSRLGDKILTKKIKQVSERSCDWCRILEEEEIHLGGQGIPWIPHIPS